MFIFLMVREMIVSTFVSIKIYILRIKDKYIFMSTIDMDTKEIIDTSISFV